MPEGIHTYRKAVLLYKAGHVRHLSVGAAFDDLHIDFEYCEAQQAIMVRRLLRRRNAEPSVIGVKCHD